MTPDVANLYRSTVAVSGVSSKFQVSFGVPHSLKVLVSAGNAWAGGLPFQRQPSVAIKDAGGNTITTDSTSTMTVALSVNPTGAPLLGTTTVTLDKGVAYFTDLFVGKRSNGYVLSYTTSAGSFSTTQALMVSYSAEFEARASDEQPGDALGSSCAISHYTAVVGAPLEDRPVDDVQVITSSGSASSLVGEVQTVRTYAPHVPEIQQLQSWVSSCSRISMLERGRKKKVAG